MNVEGGPKPALDDVPTSTPSVPKRTLPAALQRPERSPAFDAWLGENLQPLAGIDRAIANASRWDAANFRAAVADRAARSGSFTIEQVLEDTGVPVDHVNRVGALTAALAREGVIRRVGYTKARRASRAGGVVAVWLGTEAAS